MYTQCKYVVLDQDYGETIYVFPATIVHKSVATKMKGYIVSAGFIARDSNGSLFCCGESTSLQVKSRREKDTLLLRLLMP